MKRFENLQVNNNTISGSDAFELYDTYGFPIDLTEMIALEKGYTVDQKGFEAALLEQKERSRADAKREVGDWIEITNDSVEFIGYDEVSVEDAHVVKYRTVKVKDKDQYQIVLNKTPFYAEGGGQVGDTGCLFFGEERVVVMDTKKENDLIIHFVKNLPSNIESTVKGEINIGKRRLTENNHSATHLMHAALREVLGDHVQQKGSLVNEKYLRFDFSHFQKVTEEEIRAIETLVNKKIRENIALGEARAIGIEEAKAAGAMMLFGEKYGDVVRMITFDSEYSSELCGGCHVPATGKIGLFKITTETAVAAGVRRVEAVTAEAAEAYVNKEIDTLNAVRSNFKQAKDAPKQVAALIEENKNLKKEIEQLMQAQANALKSELLGAFENLDGINYLGKVLPLSDGNAIKNLQFQLEKEVGNAVIVFGAEVKGKPQLSIMISKDLAASKDLNAGTMIREAAKAIKGGGGGQAFYATAGGKDASGLQAAVDQAKSML